MRNANTHKLFSPLSDMKGILQCATQAKFWSIINRQDTYEQIQVNTDHVDQTTMTTSDSNMVSYIIQQGDCNAPITY